MKKEAPKDVVASSKAVVVACLSRDSLAAVARASRFAHADALMARRIARAKTR